MKNKTPNKPITTSQIAAGKIQKLYNNRLSEAGEDFSDDLTSTYKKSVTSLFDIQRDFFFQPTKFYQAWQEYLIDTTERSILFWDTLRQRGDNYLKLKEDGNPPLLHFDYEILLDARTFDKPVNYALAKITPPKGINIDDTQSPYIIIDPRAGHIPGIGGFKDDSQVGVALKAGHTVYFIVFYPQPEPGQTILDVTDAESIFIKKVAELHPNSPKPIVIGNCQGGWAAMMVAASHPDDIGVLLLNGAPLSYWGGVFDSGDAKNPMRYSGGLMGGSWLASFASDLGNGVFDGAHLVQNFESLNPANTFWAKYRNLYSGVDTEASRFLDFEKWWGSFSLLNEEEITWIVQNLFVGNKLWQGTLKNNQGKPMDIRNIRCPIVIFASYGDNITPPQQALNWIGDVYASTDEIKANGQVIVTLLHENIGHLGIFVSGKVAKKEYANLIPVMDKIKTLKPGLYNMTITDKADKDGEYDVSFKEYRLEDDPVIKFNKYQRIDEKPFKAVETISEFNQKVYDTFLRPIIQAQSNEQTAEMVREMHPARVEKWTLSSAVNPFMSMIQPLAEEIRENRHAIDRSSNPFAVMEETVSQTVEANLNLYRDARDAFMETLFFSIYTSPFGVYLIQKENAEKS